MIASKSQKLTCGRAAHAHYAARMRHFAFIAFALAVIVAGPLFAADDAQEKDDICAALDRMPEDLRQIFLIRPREEACRSAYWREFRPKPARELLDAESFQTYEEALAQYDCETPLALLANAFVEAYPKAPNILDDDPRKPWEGHFGTWKHRLAWGHYTEVIFCEWMRELLEAQAEIERRGLVVERYNFEGDDPKISDRSLPDAVRQRNIAIHYLMYDYRFRRFGPANLALARLSHEGKIIRFVPEYQYFLLQRALSKGIAHGELADMLTETEAKLQPSQMEDLKRQAYSDEVPGENPGPMPKME